MDAAHATHVDALRDGFANATVCASYLGVTPDDGAAWRDALARQAFEAAWLALGRTTRPNDTDVLSALAATERVRLAAALGVDSDGADDHTWFLLCYAAAQVPLGGADRDGAIALARALWPRAEPSWLAQIAAPDADDAWRAEIADAFAQASAAGEDFDRAAVAAALANRGVAAAATDLSDLALFIGALRRRLVDEDEAWRRLCAAPALAFALGYVWTHLGIGAIDDDRASDLIAACAPWFAPDAD